MEKSEGKRGLWTEEEDRVLRSYVECYGEGNWADISRRSGLNRGGKSCRLRWKNYLRPNIKRGAMSPQEQDLILRLHKLLGNRWSLIAGRLPGRTDNEVKNYWNTHLNKKYESRRKSIAEETPSKQSIASSPGQIISTDAMIRGAEESNRETKHKESIVTNSTWMEETNGFLDCIGSPLMISDYTASVFDEILPPSFAFNDLFPLL